jgi:hypothetical protein
MVDASTRANGLHSCHRFSQRISDFSHCRQRTRIFLSVIWPRFHLAGNRIDSLLGAICNVRATPHGEQSKKHEYSENDENNFQS